MFYFCRTLHRVKYRFLHSSANVQTYTIGCFITAPFAIRETIVISKKDNLTGFEGTKIALMLCSVFVFVWPLYVMPRLIKTPP